MYIKKRIYNKHLFKFIKTKNESKLNKKINFHQI